MKIKLKYLVIVFLLLIVGSHAVASPFFAEARDVMLKCALSDVKPQVIYRAYEKTGTPPAGAAKWIRMKALKTLWYAATLAALSKRSTRC